ncbi:MAG: hypothetical protein Rubg2KO_09670 [Rubricoccaceae bacterium]
MLRPLVLLIVALTFGALAPTADAQTCPPGAVAFDRACLLTSRAAEGAAVARQAAVDGPVVVDSVAVSYEIKVTEVSENTADGERFTVNTYAEWTHVPGTPFYSLLVPLGPGGEVGRGGDIEAGAGLRQFEVVDIDFRPLGTIDAAPGQLLEPRMVSTITLSSQRPGETVAEWQARNAQERAQLRDDLRQITIAETGALSRATAPAPLVASIGFDRDTVAVGEPFEVLFAVTNPWLPYGDDVPVDIRVPEPPEYRNASGDRVDVRVLSEPDPLATLAGGATDTLRYRAVVDVPVSTLTVTASVEGEWVQFYRETVAARPAPCSVGGLLRRADPLSCVLSILSADLLVNDTRDEPDYDHEDRRCDAVPDEDEEGDQCTLRAAIEEANAREKGTIFFGIEGDGPHVISPPSALPELSKPIEIDATTQPGYADAPVVVLEGSSAGPETHGLAVGAGGDGSRIAGLAVVNFGGDGIHIDTGQPVEVGLSAEGVTVEASWLGVGPGGASGNGGRGLYASGQKVEIRNNVISANRGEEGAYVLGFGSLVEDNYIGTDASGTQTLGNQGHGVTALAVAEIEGNVMSGNQGYGLRVSLGQAQNDTGLSWTQVAGNRIGTDASGAAALPNATGGVLIDGARIALRDRNRISGNGGPGVVVEGDNVVFTRNLIGAGRDGVLPNDGPGIWVRAPSDGGVSIGRDAFFGRPGENTIVGNRGDGILLDNQGDATRMNSIEIDRNDIGVLDGVAMPNEGAGIRVRGLVRGVEIGMYRLDPAGDPVGGTGNRIAGNAGPGILIDGLGSDALLNIRGNQIGVLPSDRQVIGNGSGIRIQESGNQDDDGGEIWANTIVGNRGHGIALVGASSGYSLQGNAIGVDGLEGTAAGNQGAGVFLDGPDGIVVGCIASSCGETVNEIAYNGGAGIRIGSGRRIQAARNTVYANAGGGIDLGGAGPTPNDLRDGDTGANDLLNAPVLLYAVDTRRRFSGYYPGQRETEYTLHFFANAPDTGCAQGGCQMERYLGSKTITTPDLLEGLGNFREVFSQGFFSEIPLGETITAVAVDPSGNTSEVGPGAIVVPTAQLLGVDVGPGIQGEVLKALGLSVDVTDNATRVATVQARQRAATPGADSLFVVRHDQAPRGWDVIEGSAMSPDGTTVTPDEVATAVYWSLTALGLDDVSYTACLELADIPATVPGQLVVVQRESAWAPWTPRATTLTSDNTALCASGLTGFGELAVAGDSQVNPVADEESPVGATTFALSVFPNPLRQRAVVRVELPRAAPLTVEVFDAFGRRVRQLEAAQRPAGRHDLALDADGLAAGVYLVRMTTGADRSPLVRRLTIVR